MAITKAWLIANAGAPSNSWGSKYTRIYNKTPENENQLTLRIVNELMNLVSLFSYSPHINANTAEKRGLKENQQLALNLFFDELKVARRRLSQKDDGSNAYIEQITREAQANRNNYPIELRNLKTVINEMTSSTNPLIRNTGLNCSTCVSISMEKSTTVVAYFTIDNKLVVNPLSTRNKSMLVGTLVHEMHHKMCRYDQIDANESFKYIDEFVAHWKEFSVIYPNVDLNTRIDQVHEKVASLYSEAYRIWRDIMKFNRITSIDQVGNFLVPNNEVPKILADNLHTVPPLAGHVPRRDAEGRRIRRIRP